MSDRSRIEEIVREEIAPDATGLHALDELNIEFGKRVGRKVLTEFVRACKEKAGGYVVIPLDDLDATLRTFLGEDAR